MTNQKIQYAPRVAASRDAHAHLSVAELDRELKAALAVINAAAAAGQSGIDILAEIEHYAGLALLWADLDPAVRAPYEA